MENMQKTCEWTRETEDVVSIAEACLGGLRGRSALLFGPEEQRCPYRMLLQRAGMKYIYEVDTSLHVSALLPNVQLLISTPTDAPPVPLLTAEAVAEGCFGRRTPLLIFDLAKTAPSVEEMAGLLPAVCLYTPEDLRRILSKSEMKMS
jgi:glutamyl-tRNA reductase